MIKVTETLETDVLVVGGGIAGLMAAISAAEAGAKVILAEKANTRRSGSGATGNDHFLCYIPEVHGDDIEPIIREVYDSLSGKYQDRILIEVHLKNSFDRVKDWDRWGIPMRPTGKWEFVGHALPGRPRIWLKYAGANQKLVLTSEANKRGVLIRNRLPITDIITDDSGRVVGGVGINIEGNEPTVTVVRAKAIVLATGTASRLYPSPTPGWLFNTAFCPSCTGSGRAIAYRAGAKLINMELPYTHAGPKYFARCGKATWIGVLKDLHGRPVGPFVTKPTRELGDVTADIWNSVFRDMHESGKGPVYMDCSEASEEDLNYMMWGLTNEGVTAMLDYMNKEGIDLRRYMVEFTQYEPILCGRGIEIDDRAATNVPGLYAAGDEVGNFAGFIGGAATFGWIAGKSAAASAGNCDAFVPAEESDLVREKIKFYSEVMHRGVGPSWKEANIALQQIMRDYAGIGVRSETLLKAGLKYLRDLKIKVRDTVKVDTPHDFMRYLEVLDLLDLGEVIFLTALERKETRGLHVRSDMPFTNPLYDNMFLTIHQEKGVPRLEWRERR